MSKETIITTPTEAGLDRAASHFVAESGRGYTTAMAFFNDKGDMFKTQGSMICFGKMNSIGSFMNNVTGTAVPMFHHRINTPKPVAEDYWDFLLDKENSPWRHIAKTCSVVQSGKTKMMYTTGLQGMSAQYFYNFLIAMRQPNENEHRMHAWAAYRKHGFSPLESLFMMAHYMIYNPALSGRGLKDPIISAAGAHHAFNSYASNSFIKLRDATPTFNTSQTVDKGSSFLPNDAIWHDNTIQPFQNHYIPSNKYVGNLSKIQQATGALTSSGYITTKEPLPSVAEFLEISRKKRAEIFPMVAA